MPRKSAIGGKFILAISISRAPHQAHQAYYLKALPATARILTVSEFRAEAHIQL